MCSSDLGIGIAAAHPLSRDLYAAFTKAGLKPGLIADGTGMKWSKMISNLLSNAASAILNMTPAEVYADRLLLFFEINAYKQKHSSITTGRTKKTIV